MQSNIFDFPRTLVNDAEGFIYYYPKKFPKIVETYVKLIKKYYNDPEGFREFCLEESKELLKIAGKFVDFYKKIDKIGDLKLLFEIDDKMNKLYCFKFWLYNYLVCEGPLQKFHISKIKNFSEKIVEWDVPEEREGELERIRKLLIQTDYTDFYVFNLLEGVKVYDYFAKINNFKEEVEALKALLSKKNYDYEEANRMIDELVDKVRENEDENSRDIMKCLAPILRVCEIKGENLPLYSFMMTAFKFREKGLAYKKNYEKLKADIRDIFVFAKGKLSEEDYGQFERSYKMLRLIAECKDLFGEADTVVLPFWFKLYHRIDEVLGKKVSKGPGSSYHSIMWYVSGEMKDIIFKIDDSNFDEDELTSL